jgi:carboxypeptidase Q
MIVRTVGTGDDRAPHTGAMKYAEGVTKIPAAAISISDAELLHRLLSEGTVKMHLVLLPQELAPVDGANVVGEIPGTTKAEQIVLLGAHLDSWELGMGALDDGAGCGIVLEVGRQIALFPAKPKRTVRIVLFANEENGLAGAKAYGKAHASELANHYAGIEADLGDGRVFEVTIRAAPDKNRALVDYGMLLFPLGAFVGDKDADGGADLIPLREAGVPVLELMQDATRYFDVHHSANDVVEKIVKSDLDQATAAYTAITYALADRDDDLGRIPEDGRTRH